MDHILIMRKKFKHIFVLSPYGSGTDKQFILYYIVSKKDLKSEVIVRGTKFIYMPAGNVKFSDSVNYFPKNLSATPKAFVFSELK